MSERDQRRTAWRRPAVAGLAGTAVLTLILSLESTFVRGLPFVPVAIAQRLVRITSGQVNSFFIARLGYWAERLALLGTAVGVAVSGAVAGVVVTAISRGRGGRGRWLWPMSLLPLWAASVLLYVQYPQNLQRPGFALWTLPAYVAAGGVAGWLASTRATEVEDPSRRWLLRSGLIGGAGIVLGVANLSRLVYRRPDPGDRRLVVPNLIHRAEPRIVIPGDAAFDRIPGLTPEITSNARHYVVDEELIDPDIDPASWRLNVRGLVERSLSLTYRELRALPAVERYQTLECISNRVGGHLMSTARWTGVPLTRILEMAGVKPGAVEVAFHASGGYSDSLPLEQAMDDSTLIAIGMNGYVLPRAHGFPARLLSVGTYGMKNPKWLDGIEVVDRPYRGFWEQRGWSKPAVVRTESRIDVPTGSVTVRQVVTVAGVAIAGDRGISNVEVSTDGGVTWNIADLKSPLGPYTWRLWMYRWILPAANEQAVVVRATDGNGAVQTAHEVDVYPSGATGYDRVDVTAVA